MNEPKKSIWRRNAWKILFSYVSDFKRQIVFVSGVGVVVAIVQGIIPLLVGRFFDALLVPDVVVRFPADWPKWAAILLLWAALALIVAILEWVKNRSARKIGLLVNSGFQIKAFSRLLELPLSFHKEHKSGDIVNKIGQGSWMISQIFQDVILQILPQLLTIVIGFIVAFTISPLLAGILFLGVALYVAILFKIVPPVARLHEDSHEKWNKQWGFAYDAYANVAIVKQSTAEKHEAKKMKEGFGEAASLWYGVEKIWSNIYFAQDVVIFATQSAILFFGALLIIGGEITIGDGIALFAYATLVLGPFVRLGQQWQIVENGLAAAEVADRLIWKPEKEAYFPKEAETPEISGEVEFRNVTFSYGGKTKVLDGVSFHAHPGEKIALVGRSGEGKTTLADIISGYYFPTEGEVLIDGVDIKKLDLLHLRKSIAVVPQELSLFNATIKDNLQYGRTDASEEEIHTAAKEAHADVFIEKFPEKYDQIVGERGVKLSVGQKQRVAIARAILRNPSILILDEPTSALDAETEKIITTSLERLMRGRTTFIIAHRLSTVRSADKILVVENGKIAEEGSHDELLEKNGAYRKLHDMHIGLR